MKELRLILIVLAGTVALMGCNESMRWASSSEVVIAGVSTPAETPSPLPRLGTVLLLHFDEPEGSIQFREETGKNVENPNAATRASRESQFGGGSAFFSNAHLKLEDSDDWDFGTGDFTVEFWWKELRPIRWGILVGQLPPRPDAMRTALNGESWYFAFGTTGRDVGFWGTTSGHDSYEFNQPTTNPMESVSLGNTPAGRFNHYAVTRSGTQLKTFSGGKLASQRNLRESDGFYKTNAPLLIGGYTTIQFASGWMDELRIVKGKAMYMEDFNVPTSAFGLQE